MFSKSLSRAANRTCAAVAGSSTSSSSTAAQRTAQSLAARRQPHQRRHSSSKTSSSSSCPPENAASDGKPAPAAKAVAEEKGAIADPTSQQRGAKKVTRTKRSRPAGVPDQQEDQFAGLPAVPGMHMQKPEFSVSSFFSLHRPLSVGTTIPPPSSAEAFDSIFESQTPRDPWENGNSAERRPEDVVYALRNLFDDVDHKTPQTEEEGIRWEVMHEGQDGVKHLDGPPRLKTLDEMVAQFKPFEAPPPPQPFPEQMKTAEKKSRTSKPKQKRYATTIFLTESTSETGQKTYTASTSPIVRIPEDAQAAIEEPAQQQQDTTRSGFRQRMQRNQRASFLRQQNKLSARPTATTPFIRNAPSAARLNRMLLISVKRQRKLKMKKHKYKKLMKRTRNLRRRQDRA
ncbi:putative mitochondrial mRNA-processing protein COX24 [Septoria linicola]|nr:putative mitochondrial mRNA-processing protein COX24 [Septoria linicola]